MSEKPKIDRLIIVEVKYDKIKLISLFDASIIVTNGFGIFNDKDKRELIRRIGSEYGVIIATDSDGAGQVIRGHLKGLLPAEKIACVYTPPVKGKEKRKKAPSAEGLLGVEGTDADVLYRLFEPYFSGGAPKNKMELTRARFAELGFSGGENSQAKRAALLRAARLPANMSSKAMVEALNMLYTEEEFEKLVETMAERWTSNGGAMDER